jgi:hypothetical protein
LAARVQVAIAEASAATAIASAFDQLAFARVSRRDRAIATRAGSRSKQLAAPAKSPEELGALAARAKMAVVYFLVERNRLAKYLGEVREELTEIRRTFDAAGNDGALVASGRQRIFALEATEAWLDREHAIRAVTADQLLFGLAAIFENLPAPAAKVAHRLASRLAKESVGSIRTRSRGGGAPSPRTRRRA